MKLNLDFYNGQENISELILLPLEIKEKFVQDLQKRKL